MEGRPITPTPPTDPPAIGDAMDVEEPGPSHQVAEMVADAVDADEAVIEEVLLAEGSVVAQPTPTAARLSSRPSVIEMIRSQASSIVSGTGPRQELRVSSLDRDRAPATHKRKASEEGASTPSKKYKGDTSEPKHVTPSQRAQEFPDLVVSNGTPPLLRPF